MNTMKLTSIERDDYKYIKAIFKPQGLRFVSDPVGGYTLAAIRQGNYWRVVASWKCYVDRWNKNAANMRRSSDYMMVRVC